jgi:hypothetical protein
MTGLANVANSPIADRQIRVALLPRINIAADPAAFFILFMPLHRANPQIMLLMHLTGGRHVNRLLSTIRLRMPKLGVSR